MPEMLTSPSNKRIQWLHTLHTAKGRQEAGAFLLEGPHLLEAALDAHLRPLLIVYDSEALGRTKDSARLLGRIGEAAASGVEVFTASPAAIERAGETRTPQGVVAALARTDVAPDKVRARRRGRARPFLLVLDTLSDPGNVGTLLRSALAADVDEVLLGPGGADVYAPKVVRAAAGSHFLLPMRANLSWREIATRLHGAPPARQILLAEAGAKRAYDTVDLTVRTALIVSNEAHGASAEARRLATESVSIPMWNKVESLNAAIAGSVVLFEGARQRRAAERAEREQSASSALSEPAQPSVAGETAEDESTE
jgi:TrmH family RNA methyltransferase